MKEKTNNNKRCSRSYKCTDQAYGDAMTKAGEKKTTLAKEIEKFVIRYGKKLNSNE